VSGLDFAVQSLKQIFAEVQQQLPDVFAAVKSDGMLCVRHRRKSSLLFSNHSFGTAIDPGRRASGCAFGRARKSSPLSFLQSARLVLGRGVSGDFVDSMHFELAEETILKLPDEPL